MPQLILLAVAGVGLYAGYRWVAKQARDATEAALRAQENLRQRAKNENRDAKNLGQLEWDEATQSYRPKVS